MEVQFADLENVDYKIDCIYKGGTEPNMSTEPFHKLIPGCEKSAYILVSRKGIRLLVYYGYR